MLKVTTELNVNVKERNVEEGNDDISQHVAKVDYSFNVAVLFKAGKSG